MLKLNPLTDVCFICRCPGYCQGGKRETPHHPGPDPGGAEQLLNNPLELQPGPSCSPAPSLLPNPHPPTLTPALALIVCLCWRTVFRDGNWVDSIVFGEGSTFSSPHLAKSFLPSRSSCTAETFLPHSQPKYLWLSYRLVSAFL